MPPLRDLRRFRPWLGPLISLLLLTSILFIAATTPTNQLYGGYSTGAAFLRHHVRSLFGTEQLPGQPAIRAFSADYYFIRDPSDPAAPLRIVDPDSASWDETSRLLRDHPEDVLRIHYRPEIVRSGFWAITNELDHHALDVEFGAGFTPAQRDQARALFLDRAEATLLWVPHSVFTALRRDESIDRSTTLYRGYALNLLTLLLAAAFILSLRWTLRIPAQVRALRAKIALSRGRCPTCGYSLHNLQRGLCPECGTPVKANTEQRTANM